MTRVQKNGDICHSPALKYAFLVNQLPELVVRDALKIGRHDDGRSKLTPNQKSHFFLTINNSTKTTPIDDFRFI
jgi:hypothetical protein